MADELKHPIRHVLDQVVAAEGPFEPREDVKALAQKVRDMRNGLTKSLMAILSDFGAVSGPEAADLDAAKQVQAFGHLASLTDDIEKRTNDFISVIMTQTTAYKAPRPGAAVVGEISVLGTETVVPTP
jgi:hypothetical protein